MSVLGPGVIWSIVGNTGLVYEFGKAVGDMGSGLVDLLACSQVVCYL